MLICIATGFASGLPLYLLLSLIPAWLRSNQVDLTTIGLFALVQLPYTWKFLWSPLLDRYTLPGLGLGRRRGWMALTQLVLLLGIAWLGQFSPQSLAAPVMVRGELFGLSIVHPGWDSVLAFAGHPITLSCFLIALASATQDIALDAFRREILPDAELGLGNAIHVNAYRVAGLVPGSLSLILADNLPWNQVFLITAAFMLPGLLMTFSVREPPIVPGSPRTLRAAVVEPFREFFGRHGVQSALLLLAFLFFYKLGDSLCTALATPFYQDMGFTMTEIGLVAKNAGLWPAVAGGILGGIWMFKLGINRALWLFGAVQVVSILGFAALAWVGPPFIAAPAHTGLSPDAFVQAAARDALANVCANRAILTDNAKNARTLTDNALRRYFDFDRLTAQATGLDWNAVAREPQKKLTDAFHALLLRDWAASLFQHCDWRIETKPLADTPEAQEVTVNAMLQRAGAQAIAVDFSLEKTDKGWKVFDLAINGHSLGQSYRASFAEKLRTGGVDGLIEWIREQIKTDFRALLALALVIGFEAIGVGLGTTALVAFMARTTHPAYTATQLALFTSLMALPRTLINAAAGRLVETLGWTNFFWLCFALAFPGMLLLFRVAPW
ncbi:MFS transporter [Azonexus sp.]|uniref:MFS transporter n=1 Tax=Azonexus sp. TaxID=1872668 RepID=UPI0035D46C18